MNPGSGLADSLERDLSRRRFLQVLGAAGGLAATGQLLAACGTSSSSTSVSGTINYSLVGADMQKVFSAIYPQFKATHPGVTVATQYLDWDSDVTKLRLKFTSGSPVDVFMDFSSESPGFIQMGATAPLDGVLNKSDLIPAAYNLGQVNGKLYFVPIAVNVFALYWRKDFFRSAGLDPDRAPATWDEFRDYAVKLTVRNGDNITRSGFSVESNPTGSEPYFMIPQFYDRLRQAGGNFFTPDLKTVAFNTSSGQEALQSLVDLVQKYKVDVPSAAHSASLDLFQGKTAMVISGDWVMGNFTDLSLVGVGPPPTGRQYYSEVGGDCIQLAAHAKNPAGAGELLRFILNEQNTILYAQQKGRAIPSSAAAAQSSYVTDDPFLKITAPIAAKSGSLPNHPKWNDVDVAIRPIFQEAYLGNKSVQAVLSEAASAANTLLSQS